MSNPFLVSIDPRFHIQPLSLQMCQGCGVRRAEAVHHREHKAMGGRKGAARTKSEDNANKIALCTVCHMASHLEHHIAADGFHCGSCPRLLSCYWGRRTMRLPVTGITPNW